MEINKPRLDATNFVEVWRTKSKTITNFTPILPIEDLEETIQSTINSHDNIPCLETILIAKIKFKNEKK